MMRILPLLLTRRNTTVPPLARCTTGVLLALLFLLPAAAAEVGHAPQEVDEGDQFEAWIDVEGSYEYVRFNVCTLENPYLCYIPQNMTRDEAEANDDGTYRYSFTHDIKDIDNGDGTVSTVYPGYRFELCTGNGKDDNQTKAPAGADDQYPGLEVVELADSDSYYFKVERKAAPSAAEDESLPALALPVAVAALALVARRQ